MTAFPEGCNDLINLIYQFALHVIKISWVGPQFLILCIPLVVILILQRLIYHCLFSFVRVSVNTGEL